MTVKNQNQPLAAGLLGSHRSAMIGMYRLLSRIWIRELDEAFLVQIRSSPLSSAFVGAGGILPSEGTSLDELAVDYCRLFVGPTDHLPPFESVWKTGQFQSETTTSMRDFMSVIGYSAKQSDPSAMLDHLAVQLDLMAAILEVRHQAVTDSTTNDDHDSNSESADPDLVLDVARTYFHQHLTWPSTMIAAAAERASTPFYRSSIELTGNFLAMQANDF